MKSETSLQIIDSTTFILNEYSSLREEMLNRIGFQNQIITLTIVAVGTFLTIGTKSEIVPVILLIYPIIAAFLAIGWYQQNLRIKRIGDYIRKRIESRVLGGGWEQYRTLRTAKIRASATALFACGTFVGTEVLTIVLALPRIAYSKLEITLLIFDGIAIVITLLATRRLPMM